MSEAVAGTVPGAAASWRSALARMPASARVGAAVLAIYAVAAATGPIWVPYGATEILVGLPFSGPSFDHLLGTDNLGRDVFSRVVLGSTAVLAMTMAATSLAVTVGTLVGVVFGYLRGWADEIAMRVVDILISIPPLILGLLVISALGNSMLLVVLTVAVLFAPRVARVVRAATLSIVTADYVTAAVARGESSLGICIRELLPNVAGIVLVEFAIRSGFAIMFIGALGFLGFGAPPPTPEWGLMINEGRSHITSSLWPVLSPAMAMALLVIAINLFTDGLSRLIGGTAQARGDRQ